MTTITCPKCGKAISAGTGITTRGTLQQGVLYANTPDGHRIRVTAIGAVVTKCPKGNL
jgi:hypothetical protein